MFYSSYGYKPGFQFLEVFAIIFAGICAISLIFGILCYILQAIGLYKIARRRGIRHAGLAWVPLGNMWILGSIADQFQYVVKGKIRNRRKSLLWLSVVLTALTVVAEVCTYFVSVLLPAMPAMADILRAWPLLAGWGMAIIATFVIAIVAVVIEYIAYYNLFFSCNPDNNVVFLVLGILFPVLLPFFVFSQRNRDYGMPPRKPII